MQAVGAARGKRYITAMATQADPRELDLQEQLVRIRRMVDESDKLRAETQKMFADANKASMDVKIAPWQFAVGGITAGAALAVAIAALTKLFL